MIRGLWAFWALCACVAAGLPLLADEAYYLGWSRDLSLGYFDHPPGIALWVAAGLGHPRLPGLLCLPLTVWLLIRAAEAWGVATPQRLPMFALWTPLGLAGCTLATPDAPLLPLFSGLLWALGAGSTLSAGLLLGACLWSKSTVLAALPAVALLSGRRRAPPIFALAALVYAPHVLWSVTHGGLPFTFQAGRLGQGFHLPEMLLGALLVVPPPLSIGLLHLAVGTLRGQGALDGRDRALAAAGLSILGAWAVLACVSRVEANWPALAWLPLLMLGARRAPNATAHAHRVARTLTAALGVGILAACAALPLRWGPPRDPEGLAACLAEDPSVVAVRYQEKALLDLTERGPVPYLRPPGRRASQYDLQGAYAPIGGACGALVLAAPEVAAPACPGDSEPVARCGRTFTACRCPPKADLVPHPSEGYARPAPAPGVPWGRP